MFTLPEVKEGLIEAQKKGLVKIKSTPENTVIVKYTQKCMFDLKWNPIIINFARGHSFTPDFSKLVCNPFPKSFNLGENRFVEDFRPDDMVWNAMKRNGFMLSATKHNGDLYISTTGTTHSDFAVLGRSWVEKSGWADRIRDSKMDKTWLFEVCDSSDPHIAVEPEGIHLIGVRSNDVNCGFNEREIYQNAYSQIKEDSLWAMHEGYMCWVGNKVVKLKSPYYVTLKKIARAPKVNQSEDQKVNAMMNGIERSVKMFPDHPVFGDYKSYVDLPLKLFATMDEQQILSVLRPHFENLMEKHSD